tara:strand:+ start:79 stop:681 length:603 start_codon:yes stop_codon:yes gene_type:complete
MWDLPTNNNNYSKSNMASMKKNTKATKKGTHTECKFCMAKRTSFDATIEKSNLSYGQKTDKIELPFCNEACVLAWSRQEIRIDIEQSLATPTFITADDYAAAIRGMKVLSPDSLAYHRCEFAMISFMAVRMTTSFNKALLSRSETKAKLHERRLKIKEKYGELLELAMSNDDSSDMVRELSNMCVKFGNDNMGEITAFAK